MARFQLFPRKLNSRHLLTYLHIYSLVTILLPGRIPRNPPRDIVRYLLENGHPFGRLKWLFLPIEAGPRPVLQNHRQALHRSTKRMVRRNAPILADLSQKNKTLQDIIRRNL